MATQQDVKPESFSGIEQVIKQENVQHHDIRPPPRFQLYSELQTVKSEAIDIENTSPHTSDVRNLWNFVSQIDTCLQADKPDDTIVQRVNYQNSEENTEESSENVLAESGSLGHDLSRQEMLINENDIHKETIENTKTNKQGAVQRVNNQNFEENTEESSENVLAESGSLGHDLSRQEMLINENDIHKETIENTKTNKQDINSHWVEQNGKFCCRQCDNEYRDLQTCRRHILQLHLSANETPYSTTNSTAPEESSKRLFQCDFCDEKFYNRRKIIEHLEEHEKKQLDKDIDLHWVKKKDTYCCLMCDETYSRRDKCRGHIRAHLNVRPYACKLCDKTFTDKYYMDTHLKNVHHDGMHQCKECGRKYGNASGLKDHANFHLGKTPYKCKDCKKQFSERQQLVTHVQCHETLTASVCDLCGKVYSNFRNFHYHRKYYHDSTVYKCEECKVTFNNKRHLYKHNRRRHMPIEKRPVCDLCSKTFCNRDTMISHLASHAGKLKIFNCTKPDCDKVFSSQSYLREHLFQHDGIAKYSCEICGKTFFHASNLTSHKFVHREKKFECTLCGVKFKMSAQLKCHVKKHESSQFLQKRARKYQEKGNEKSDDEKEVQKRTSRPKPTGARLSERKKQQKCKDKRVEPST